MNGPTIFGPFGRFMIRPVWHAGETIAHDLLDAEGNARGGPSVVAGRFKWADEAFTKAAWMLGPNTDDASFGATLAGQRFTPA